MRGRVGFMDVLISKYLEFPIINKQVNSQMSSKPLKQNTQIDVHPIFASIFHIFHTLFNSRLINKITRPMGKHQRELLISQFKLQFDQLHAQLETLKKASEMGNKDANNWGTNKQKIQSPIHNKSQIPKIEEKYKELFIYGSFKHYEKICQIFELPISMKLINIEYWSHTVYTGMKKQTKCCC